MLYTKVANFIIFQSAWFAAAYLHNHFGALLCASLGLINIFPFDEMFRRRVFAALLVIIIGLANDYLLYYFKIIIFPGQSFTFLPLWLLAIWLAFSSTLHSSLFWLRKLNLLQQSLVGGIGGAVSYVAGAKLGAVEYQFSVMPAFAWHFLNWCILLPLIVKIHRSVD